MNDQGIFIELNNGEAQDPTEVQSAEDSSVLLVRILNKAGTLEEAYGILAETPADLSDIIQIADERGAISAERPTFAIRARQGKYPGLLAAYNSFVEPYPTGWGEKLTPPPKTSMDPRLINIRTLANSAKFKGHLDLAGMKALLDIDVAHGGAVHPGTVLQVIAIPHKETVWIRGLEYSDWQEVALTRLFQRVR